MDYSTLPSDPDLPAGTSPWQSSPQLDSRQSFTASEAGSRPSSALAQHSSYTYASQRPLDDGGSDQETLGDGANQQREGNRMGSQPENGTSSDRSQGLVTSDEEGYQHHQQQHRHQQSQQPQTHQRAVGPNRYHGSTRPAQRQPLPQYKLQAKIAGLERTGRKDPVLRFDVHVCYDCFLWSL